MILEVLLDYLLAQSETVPILAALAIHIWVTIWEASLDDRMALWTNA